MEVRTSFLNRVDGSAELKLGKTSVLVSVTGPIEPKLKQELPNSASLEIVVRPAIGVSTTREKLMEDKLRDILQAVIIGFKYPRQLIQIVVQVLTTDEMTEYTLTEFNTAINCCYFALIDANISLYSSFASVAACVMNESSSGDTRRVIFSPSMDDLKASISHHVICFEIKESKANKILLLESNGSFSEDELFSVIESAGTECEKIHKQQRDVITAKIQNDFIWK